MIKLSKLADYGIVLMTYFARAAGDVGVDNDTPRMLTARELAEASKLPMPTVGKILKSLSRAGLLVSHRGVHGGYSLAKRAEAISVTEMVAAVDGPVALTECSATTPALCEIEACCPVRSNWQRINAVVLQALEGLTLADMTHPLVQLNKKSSDGLINFVRH